MKKRILSLILALSMVLSVLPLGAFAEGSNQGLTIGSDGYPTASNGNGWSYDSSTEKLTLRSGTYDFSSTAPVQCAIHLSGATAKITGGTFAGSVTNGGTISGGTFRETCYVTNEFIGTISGGTFAGSVENRGTVTGGVFKRNATLTDVTGLHSITWDAASSKANIVAVNDVAANWAPYAYKGTTVTITASTEIYSLNGKLLTTNDRVNGDKKTVKFTMPDKDVVLSTGELVMKDGLPDTTGMTPQWERYIGHNWGYDSSTKTLTLLNGTFDFSSTHPQTPNATGARPVPAVKCAIESYATTTITGGTFTGGSDGKVTNYGTISGGNFKNTCSVTNGGTITGNGTFNGTVTNNFLGTISDGTFTGTVENSGTISGGTFQDGCSVTNKGTIKDNGTFEGTVTNSGTIENGTFAYKVENNGSGAIFGGTFKGTVTNNAKIYGGVFNGKTGLDGVTGLHSIAVASGAKIEKVNDVSADWAPYVVVTDEAKTKVVTITADTDIYSLNGYPIDGSPYTSSYPKPNDKKTVKFTMPSGNVVLSTGDLVMAGGYPVGSNNGTADCEGKGWTYSKKDASNPKGKLTLKSGTFDFNSTYPQNTSKGAGAEPVACAVETQLRVEITGGTFEGEVINNDLGEISGGTFYGTVTNSGYIKDGTFNGKVTNRNTIENGTFAGSVTNEGTIKNGSFEKKVTNGRTIMDGVFKGVVENGGNGTIFGGTFAGRVNNSYGGHIFGGVFNGYIKVQGAGVYSITVDTASSKAEIKEVNGVSAVWEPYVVVAELTKNQKVIITASTKIYSLNHKPLSTDNCNSAHDGNENTVKFTMPNANVVLNGAITSTDLVMENGWPKDSNGGKNPCKGDGWEYIPNDPTNGNMLLLTGSNQTGGLFDFSTIGDGSAVECNVFVGKPTAITGGEFNGKVFNNSGILGGTFHGEVDNMGPGRIVNGTFKNSVENNGTIEKGTFEGTVENNTNGTISGGTFAGSVSNNGGTVNGGVFNGNTGLDGVTDLHSITVASNAKIEKVNGVSAEWAPYVVTSNATTKEVTITADTEIFSLNGQPIGAGNCNSSYGVDKKTVTFTMPDDDVVLNGELITKPEPEPEPKPEPKPEPEPEPEPTTYTVTVIGGTIDGKTSVSAKENDTLTVVLDQSEIPDGMTFDMWSISSSKLSGDINVDYRAEAMTFQMPAEDVTIRAQYRSAEIIEDAAPSPLATAATIAVGGAAAGIVVWQGVNLGVDLYLANALPQGVPVPTDRRALALLLWETAGKPEVALPTLYGDIPAEEIELQKATRWAVQNGLMDAADKKDASFFDPDHYVTKMDVFGAWLRLKKLLGTT